jgi:hypothetical protein
MDTPEDKVRSVVLASKAADIAAPQAAERPQSMRQKLEDQFRQAFKASNSAGGMNSAHGCPERAAAGNWRGQ